MTISKDRLYLAQSRRVVRVLKALGIINDYCRTSYYAWSYRINNPTGEWAQSLTLYVQYSNDWGMYMKGKERFKLYDSQHKLVFSTESLVVLKAYIEQHYAVLA